MSDRSGFWGWHAYAKANDDIRKKLIEEGWYGRQSQDDPVQRDVAGMESKSNQDFYGNTSHDAAPDQDWNGDPEANARSAFYGQSPESDEMSAFYGQDTDQGDPAAEFYGHDPEVDQGPEHEH